MQMTAFGQPRTEPSTEGVARKILNQTLINVRWKYKEKTIITMSIAQITMTHYEFDDAETKC